MCVCVVCVKNDVYECVMVCVLLLKCGVWARECV